MAMLILGLAFVLASVSDGVKIIGGNVTVVQGGTAEFPCKAIDVLDYLEQISWQRLTRGYTQRDIFFFTITQNWTKYGNGEDKRFKFNGDFSKKNGTLMLSDVTLMDEGTYTCIFTLFPSGDHQTDIPLKVLVPPSTSLKESNLTLGKKEVVLATCTAASSKPPSEVKWLTHTLGNKVRISSSSTPHDNGTETTVSVLFGIPTRDISNYLVQCVIKNPALSIEETLPFTIKVHSPPEVNITETSANAFECQAAGYPTPEVTWSRRDKLSPMPGVKVEGATLHFPSPSSDLNGFYVCEARNANGEQRGHLFFHYSPGSCAACWTLFALLLILVAAAVAAGAYLYKSEKVVWKEEGTASEMQKVRQTSHSSEENRNVEEDEEE